MQIKATPNAKKKRIGKVNHKSSGKTRQNLKSLIISIQNIILSNVPNVSKHNGTMNYSSLRSTIINNNNILSTFGQITCAFYIIFNT